MPRVSLCLALCLGLLVPLPALACQLPANAPALRSEVIALTNRHRAAKGLPALAENPALAQAAAAHACDNAETRRMSHRGSDGSDLPTRLKRTGYPYREAFENVAAGFSDAAAVMAGWMGSQGHRRNILARNARDIGVGVAAGADGQLYWTMNLGRS